MQKELLKNNASLRKIIKSNNSKTIKDKYTLYICFSR